MAAAAETLQYEQVVNLEQQQAVAYLSVDQIPELRLVRESARTTSAEIIEKNRQLLCDGAFESVPLDVDAMGTARRAIETRQVYGENSPEFIDQKDGLLLDCRRLYAEAARKLTYEYFPLSRQQRQVTGEYFSHGHSILSMTEKGLTPLVEAEECDRRANEHVEERTYMAIGVMALEQTVQIMTVSECTDWAINAHQRKSKGAYGGYVPEIEKLMIRNVVFDPISSDRFEEQIGLPGVYITPEIIRDALWYRGQEVPHSKTELHGTQILHQDDLFDFVALLDNIASERSGQNIYMGEVLIPGKNRDYANVRQEAEVRQAKLQADSIELAEFILGLENAHTDRWLAVGLVEQFVKKSLMKTAQNDIEAAAYIFDDETAKGLEKVSVLRSTGQMNEAELLMSKVEAGAPAPGYCGAGSCGLEAVSSGSKEEMDIADDLGLDATKGLLRDTERACPSCNRKKIVYDLKGKKGCTGCKSTARYK